MTTSEILEYIDSRIKELNPDGKSNNVTDLWVCAELVKLKKMILNET